MSDDPIDLDGLRQALAEAEERQRELVRHQRNVLAVVRALVRQPVAGTSDAGEYRARLEGRIDAFARVQSTLLRDLGRGTDLDSLIRDQFVMFGIRAEEDVGVAGPAIRLDARATGLMALLVHELALGTLEDSGHPLSVSWQVEGERSVLSLVWIDHGKGARDLDWIERAFSYELKGSLIVELDGEGRRCTASLPSRHLIAVG